MLPARPLKAGSEASRPETAPELASTATWKDSNSLPAAAMLACEPAPGGSALSGRICASESKTLTWGVASAAAGTARIGRERGGPRSLRAAVGTVPITNLIGELPVSATQRGLVHIHVQPRRRL